MNGNKKLVKFVVFDLITLLVFLTLAGLGWAAEKFPTREIVIIHPYAAGSSTDLPTRLLAEYLKKDLGVPVVVENPTEGQGVKGIMDVYKAKPDGYILLMNLFPRHAQMEVAYKTPYKILEMTYFPAYIRAYQCVTVKNDSPYKSLKDLIEASKKKPLTCSVSGVGSNAHLLAEMLKRRAGLNLNAVPFRGGVPAMTALLGGNVDMTTVDDLQLVVHQDKVRPLAINSDERHKNFPGVPTVKELGYPVPVVYTLAGIAGPPGMPRDVQAVLLDAITKVARNPEFAAGVEKVGANLTFMTAPDFRAAAESYYKLAIEYKDIFAEQK